MLETLRWLLVIELISLAATPVVIRAFPSLADKGWAFSRPVGLVLLGTVMWLLSYIHMVPNSMLGWWTVIGVLALASAILAYRGRVRLRHFLTTRWRIIVATEIVFMIFFIAVALLRASNPAIQGTEKPMELMLLNASVETQYAPPEDAWLSGHPVSYYYFGYWMFGGLSTLASVPTEYAFNLALAFIAGAGAAAMFGLCASLVRREGGSHKNALMAGGGAAALLIFVASLAGWWEFAAHFGLGSSGFYEWLGIDGLAPDPASAGWRPDQHWWWFRASRVINTFGESGAGLDFTIQEFPAFSFLLGDLHPHVISIPFVLAGIGVAANIFLSHDRWELGWLRRNPWATAVMIAVLGSSGFINAWDLAFLAALLVGVVVFKTMRERHANIFLAMLNAALPLLIVGMASVALYSPYYLGTLESQVQDYPIGPVKYGTRVVHFLTVWGALFLLAAPFVARILKQSLKPQLEQANAPADAHPSGRTTAPWPTWWLGISLLVVPYIGWLIAHLTVNENAGIGDAITRLSVAGPMGFLFLGMLATLAWRSKRGASDATQFVLILAALITYMLYGTELLFVHDLFGNRMNTVFKLYYQTWIGLSLVCGIAAFAWWRFHPRLQGRSLLASRTVAVLLVVLAIGPLYYPVAAAVTRTNEYGRPMTLDGLAWLADQRPDEYAAIQWLRDNADPGSVVVESVEGSYTGSARISETTGLPTVIGWTGHENQWRDIPAIHAGRPEDVRVLYETSDIAEAEEVIAKYNITYAVVGSRERDVYSGLDASKFDTLGSRAFEQGSTVIYRLQ